jgi:hypothetical protein
MPEPSPHPRRSSEKRQRHRKTDIRWGDSEYSVLLEKAHDVGLTPAAYIRAVVTGTPGPRAQRKPHVNALELGKATAALNQSGNLLNQMAHVLNAGGSIRLASECFAAIAENRAAAAAVRAAVGRKNRDDS